MQSDSYCDLSEGIYYSENESNCTPTLVAQSTNGCSHYPDEYEDTSISSETLSSTPMSDDMTMLENVCNSNQVRCSVNLPKTGYGHSKYKPIPDDVWTEGLAWPQEELVVVHSDVNARNNIRILSNSPNSRHSVRSISGERHRDSSAARATQTPTVLNRPVSFLPNKLTPCSGFQRADSGCSQGSTVKLIPTHANMRKNMVSQQSNADRHLDMSFPGESILERRVDQYIEQYFPQQSKKALFDKVNRRKSGSLDDATEQNHASQEYRHGGPTNRRCASDKPESRFNRSSSSTVIANSLQQNKAYSTSRGVPNVPKLTNIHSALSLASQSETSSKQSNRRHRVTINGTTCDSKPPIPHTAAKKKSVISAFAKRRLEQGDQEVLSSIEKQPFSKQTPRINPTTVRMSMQSRSSIRQTPTPNHRKPQISHSKCLNGKTSTPEHRGRASQPFFVQNKLLTNAPGSKRIFSPVLITSFNTVAHKLSRINSLSRELSRIHQRVKQIQSYSRLGQFYCLADAYISILCAHMAPHILCATMGHSYIRPVAQRRLAKRSHFPTMNLLSVSTVFLENLLKLPFRRRRWSKVPEQHKDKLGRAIKHDRHYAESIPNANLSNSNSAQMWTFESIQTPASRNEERNGKLPQNNSSAATLKPCRLIGLPVWEQKFLGVTRGQRSPKSVCLAWKDRLVSNPVQIDWLKNATRHFVQLHSIGLKSNIHNN